MHRKLFFLLIPLIFNTVVKAQDTLPRFSATARGTGKILISWRNNLTGITLINIQRSFDSLKNFTTLLTVPDPKLPQNGAVDTKAPDPNLFYRLFVVLDNGKYFFTRSQRPHSDMVAVKPDPHDIEPDADMDMARIDRQRIRYTPGNSSGKPQVNSPSRIHDLPMIEIEKPVYIKRGDTLIMQIPGKQVRSFRDSILARTKDTLVFIDGDTLSIKPFVAKEVYKVSPYVFTGKYGNIHVALPDAPSKRYAVKFFDENNKLLFELAAIKDPSLILDKSNFLHAGWFRFELYEDEKLMEKNKLFIPRDF